MNPVEIIRKKREGESLSPEEIKYMIEGFTGKKIPDYQFSAFLMAVYFKGMTKDETSELTKSMLYSGKVVDLSKIEGVKIDKHSTGGVGDKTSLILAPIAAAAGVKVPMISGRGLGHTGGTLDKLESIPGFTTDLSLSEYKSVLKKTGAVLIGQTKDIAPADKAIYSLRDVTATVESVPLITASIMSKKLAEGIDGLILDVKVGSGAFMRTTKDAIELTESLVNTAKAFNKKVIAFITDMNQPLGTHIGNWLEVIECIDILRGEVKNDLYKLSTKLAGAMIYLAERADSIEDGTKISESLISDGKALDKFREIVKAQGGDISFIDNPGKYTDPKHNQQVISQKSGYISAIDTYEIGMSSIELGAGRKTMEDKIDHKAGIILRLKVGDKIKKGEPVAQLFSDSDKGIEFAKDRILKSITISKNKPTGLKLIKKILK